jgi:gentisate 1,2-dioxygenase
VKVTKTLGAAAERLDAGATSAALQETASSVYHVYAGSGYTDVDGRLLRWKQGDTFAVPAWSKYQHTASQDGRVYLYRTHDKPMLKALGYYRVANQEYVQPSLSRD